MLVHAGTLAEHHRRCEAHFAAARKAADAGRWSEIGALVGTLREAVLEHFRYEEQHIFPLYEQTSGQEGATEWLCAQHDDMRGTLWMICTLSPQDDPQRYLEELVALQVAFDAHAAAEESRMYPVFERMLAK